MWMGANSLADTSSSLQEVADDGVVGKLIGGD
ncbi:hypothetical protein QG37_06998 [Candidozyma auris]|uniref:Uncharacterized protein n=1 Tax=Candidozyma auris TaxID=498019 RepID=A0A0L0NRM3_CANAR|nr:hypothetical protein QG37_06998 [[Candida] auris]